MSDNNVEASQLIGVKMKKHRAETITRPTLLKKAKPSSDLLNDARISQKNRIFGARITPREYRRAFLKFILFSFLYSLPGLIMKGIAISTLIELGNDRSFGIELSELHDAMNLYLYADYWIYYIGPLITFIHVGWKMLIAQVHRLNDIGWNGMLVTSTTWTVSLLCGLAMELTFPSIAPTSQEQRIQDSVHIVTSVSETEWTCLFVSGTIICTWGVFLTIFCLLKKGDPKPNKYGNPCQVSDKQSTTQILTKQKEQKYQQTEFGESQPVTLQHLEPGASPISKFEQANCDLQNNVTHEESSICGSCSKQEELPSAGRTASKSRKRLIAVSSSIVALLVAGAVVIAWKPNPLGDMIKNGMLSQPVSRYKEEALRIDIVRHYSQYRDGKEELSAYAYVPALLKFVVLQEQDINAFLPVLDDVISAGANPDATLSDGIPPLFIAIENSHLDAIRTLLEAKADVNIRNNSQETAIHLAAKKDNLKLLELLLSHGASCNEKDNYSDTPLMIALRTQHPEITARLIKAGADVNHANTQGETPLSIACNAENEELIKILLTNGAKVNFTAPGGKRSLFIAIEKGNLNIVKRLLHAGANLQEADEFGETPLTCAARGNSLPVLKELLQAACNPKQANKKGDTPLILATQNNQAKHFVPILLPKSSVNATNKKGQTAIFHAVYDARLLHKFVKAKASVRVKDIDGVTLLAHAVSHGSKQSVAYLLKSAARKDINAPDKSGNTPLIRAIINNNHELVKLLIKNKADVNVHSAKGLPLIALAAQKGNEGIVQELIASGADATETFEQHGTRKSAIDLAYSHNVVEILKEAGCVKSISTDEAVKLLQQCKIVDPYAESKEIRVDRYAPYIGHYYDTTYDNSYSKLSENFLYNYKLCTRGMKSINDYDYSSIIYKLWEQKQSNHLPLECILSFINAGCYLSTPSNGISTLQYAAFHGHIAIVKALIAAKADINFRNDTYSTPLCFAAKKGHADIVNILLEAGADPNIDAPLLTATHNGHTECMKLLLAAPGIDINTRYTKQGQTPLVLAVKQKNAEHVKLLLEAKADVNASDNNGYTPLHIAAKEGLLEIAKDLIVNGADTNAKTGNGDTPLQLASNAGHSDMVQLLLSSGSNAENISLHEAATKDISQLQTLLKAGAGVNEGNAIYHAAAAGRADAVKLLLDSGADVCTLDPNTKKSALVAAADKGHIDIARMIAATGRDKTTESLLWSIMNDDAEICRLVLKAGANPNQKALPAWMSGECSFLKLAIQREDLGVITAMLQGGAKPDMESSDKNLLLNAINHNKTEIAILLIQSGFPLQRIEGSVRKSPELEMAIDKENVKVFTELIKRKAHIGVTWGPPDESFLHYLVSEHKYTILKAYLAMGVQVNVKDRGGRTPLVNAVLRSDVTAVKLLLSKGASPHIVLPTTKFYPYTHSRDSVYSEDYSLLHAAAREGNAEVVKALLAAGANPGFARRKLNLSYGETSRYAYPHDDTRSDEVRDILLRAYRNQR